MGTTLYQNLTTIIFVSLFFAGPFSSFAQPNERARQFGDDYSYDYGFPPPNVDETPKKGANVSPPPLLSGNIGDINVTNFQSPSPPLQRRAFSNLSPPPPQQFGNATDESVSRSTGKLNRGKTFGLAFLTVAVVLQIVLGGFLMYKRRKIANF